jgi:transposase
MQTQLPFFPTGTKLINGSLGFREQDSTVYYLHNGNPIYCHSKDDSNGYRFALANLVVNKLCTIKELSESLGEKRRNIERYAQSYRAEGAAYFFERKDRRGECYRMTPEKITAIQQELDNGKTQRQTSKKYDISEAAIRYHIANGNLKKK